MLLTCSISAYGQTNNAKSVDPAAAVLLEKHSALASQLANNAYGRPLALDSVQTGDSVAGNIYAVLDTPLSQVSSSFNNPKRLCDMMILHINTKYCHPTADTSPSVLLVNFGKKTPQALVDTYSLEFTLKTNALTANYFQVQLHADKGPMRTSNYGIDLAAVALPDGKTFLHLRYSYGFGVAGRVAMQAYLSTVGSGKVGFTLLPQTDVAQRAYVGGMRGAVECNMIRYYLAIDAYLMSLSVAQSEQQNRRLEKWFDSTEQYPLQLRETDKIAYLSMKRDEIKRQQAVQQRP